MDGTRKNCDCDLALDEAIRRGLCADPARRSSLVDFLERVRGASARSLAAAVVASAAETEDSPGTVATPSKGPALDLSGCAFGLDPRLDGSCSEQSGPVPAGACFCPRHAESALYYAPLTRGTPLPAEEGDELPP